MDRDISQSDAESTSNRSFLRASGIWVTAAVVTLVVAVAPVMAQSSVGDIYCGTQVETGIDILFGAVAGLGLPATMYYTGKSGFSYMRSGGHPERKDQAREKLVMSGMGLGIIILALLAPELVDKLGSQLGFTFSDCVQPF